MSDSHYLDWDTLTRMEIIYAFLGEKLASGCFRDVWTCRSDPTVVVKIEKAEQAPSFDNVLEWKIWQECQHDADIALWLAPCVSISPGGRVLVMKRTQKVTPAELALALPRVPRFFHDVHSNNWGRIGTRYVCHDYAFNEVDDEYSAPCLWKSKRVKWLD